MRTSVHSKRRPSEHQNNGYIVARKLAYTKDLSNLRFNEGTFTLKVFWKVRIVLHFILPSMSDSQRIQY